MKMNKKVIRIGLVLLMVGLIAGGSVAFYMFNMPHRDVQASVVDYEIGANALVSEYLEDAQMANQKYLGDDGESRILAVSGTVHSINTDMNNQRVVLLKGEDAGAGVSCTFMQSTNANAKKLKDGDEVTIKGVIRSGAGYDEDLGLYEDVIMEKCDLYQN